MGALHLDLTMVEFINDGLMAVFFFVVGLEIKRELVSGELRDPRAAALPVLAALGGMIVPAAIYAASTAGMGAEVASGWGIPMATDIAFAVGVLSLLGRRIPSGARLFILTLAIADDLGAIAVIAIAYSAALNLRWLAFAAALLAMAWIGRRAGIRSLAFYMPLAVAVWFATLESGVHATIAGVALALLTPTQPLSPTADIAAKERSHHDSGSIGNIPSDSVAPLKGLEDRLLPWTSYLIVPLFALANAGVDLRGVAFPQMFANRVALGIALGLLVGKAVGITVFTWLGVRFRWGALPSGTDWRQLRGLAVLGGIGFTVSLLIGSLAFGDEALANVARIGIFTGSFLSGIVGSVLLLRASSATVRARSVEPGAPVFALESS
jgi:NhaA family Na+:H+ antiporter